MATNEIVIAPIALLLDDVLIKNQSLCKNGCKSLRPVSRTSKSNLAKQDTNMKDCIKLQEMCCVMLRYLAKT